MERRGSGARISPGRVSGSAIRISCSIGPCSHAFGGRSPRRWSRGWPRCFFWKSIKMSACTLWSPRRWCYTPRSRWWGSRRWWSGLSLAGLLQKKIQKLWQRKSSVHRMWRSRWPFWSRWCTSWGICRGRKCRRWVLPMWILGSMRRCISALSPRF